MPVWLGGCGLWFCQSANSTLSIKLHSVMCLLTRTKKLENKKQRNKKEDKRMVKSGSSASGTKMQQKEQKRVMIPIRRHVAVNSKRKQKLQGKDVKQLGYKIRRQGAVNSKRSFVFSLAGCACRAVLLMSPTLQPRLKLSLCPK